MAQTKSLAYAASSHLQKKTLGFARNYNRSNNILAAYYFP